MRTAPDITTAEQRHLMATLDLVSNLNGHLDTDARARIFAAIADGTHEAWVAARSVIIHPATLETLWQAVHRTQRTCGTASGTPRGKQIAAALEHVAVEIAMAGILV